MNTVFPRLCAHALISALPRISAYPLLDLDCSSSLIAFETKLQFFPLLTRRFQSFQHVFFIFVFFSRKFLCSRFSRLLTSKGDEQGSQSGKAEVVTHGNLKVGDMSL